MEEKRFSLIIHWRMSHCRIKDRRSGEYSIWTSQRRQVPKGTVETWGTSSVRHRARILKHSQTWESMQLTPRVKPPFRTLNRFTDMGPKAMNKWMSTKVIHLRMSSPKNRLLYREGPASGSKTSPREEGSGISSTKRWRRNKERGWITK